MTSLLFRPGDKGTDVRVLQHTLNAAIEAYCPRHKASDIIKPDGDYGPLTARAVRMVQRARDLVVDAVAGPKTLNQLFDVVKEESRILTIETFETFRTRPRFSSPFTPPSRPGAPPSRPGSSPIGRMPTEVHFGTVGRLLAPPHNSHRSYAGFPTNLRGTPAKTEKLTAEIPPPPPDDTTPPPETTRRWIFRDNPFGFSLNVETVPKEYWSYRVAQMATVFSGVFISPKFWSRKDFSTRAGGHVTVYDGAVKDISVSASFNYSSSEFLDRTWELGRISRFSLFVGPGIDVQAIGSITHRMFLAQIFGNVKVATSIAIGQRVYVSIWAKAGALFCAQMDKDGAALACTPDSAGASGYFKSGLDLIFRFGHRPSRHRKR